MCQGIILHLILYALHMYHHQQDLRWGTFVTVLNSIQTRQEETQKVTWLEDNAVMCLEIVLEDAIGP